MIRRRAQLGFTITELLVVITILSVVIGIAIPSFSSMIRSTDRALASNSLQSAVRVARDLAVSSPSGGDGAIVAVFEPGGSIKLIPAIQIDPRRYLEDAPSILSLGGATGTTPTNIRIRRDVFVPAPGAEVITLPPGYGLRGYAPAGSMITQTLGSRLFAEWYDSPLYGGDDPDAEQKQEGNWVFPETNLYDVTQQALGANATQTPRQSFMIRFDAGTGELSRNPNSAVFLDPRPSTDRPYPSDPTAQEAWKRVDLASDPARWAVRVIGADMDGDGVPWAVSARAADEDLIERSELLGNRSMDTILVKPVTRLALYERKALAQAIGMSRLNRETASLYTPFNPDSPRAEIAIDRSLFDPDFSDTERIRRNINAWISGDTAPISGGVVGDGEIILDQDDPDADKPAARLFVVGQYSGELREVVR